MMVFLPYSSFEESAKVLDNQRLKKQLIECHHILRTNIGLSKGWKNHPAVLMFKEYEKALIDYSTQIYLELRRRDFFKNSQTWKEICSIATSIKEKEYALPKWLGNEEIHKSHRARLLMKGAVDSVSYSLRRHLKVRSINEWLISNGYPPKNRFKLNHLDKLTKYCQNLDVEIEPNWYQKFFPNEQMVEKYIWPKLEKN